MDDDSKNVRNPNRGEWRTVYEWDDRGLLDPEERIVEIKGSRVHLTRQEFEALRFLVENAPNLVYEAPMYKRVWGTTTVDSASVSKLIYRVRQKLADAGAELVPFEKSGGYRFDRTVRIEKKRTTLPQLSPLNAEILIPAEDVFVERSVVFSCEPTGGVPPYGVSWSGFLKTDGSSFPHIFREPGVYSLFAEITDSVGGKLILSAEIKVLPASQVLNPNLILNRSQTDSGSRGSIAYRLRSIVNMRAAIILGFCMSTAALAVVVSPHSNWLSHILVAAQLRREFKSPADEAEVRRVLTESQSFETLGIYEDPTNFDRNRLKEYWVPVERGGKAILNIQAAVLRLLQKKVRYGRESKADLFEIVEVTILAPGDYAEARTREKWYLPTYHHDGARAAEKTPFFGPYRVDYTFRKIDGKWLLQSAGTPYSQ